jgi:flagellar biosynthesis regulator FlbT
MITVDLSLEQLVNALKRLPAGEKMVLWRLLDAEIDRPAISKRFAEALEAIRSAYPDAKEDEVMGDVMAAVREVRRARHGA